MSELERVGFHPVALEVVERIDRDREAQSVRIADAEARLAEFDGQVDADAALDFYNGLVETVQGRVKGAHGVGELNEALGQRSGWLVVRGRRWASYTSGSSFGGTAGRTASTRCLGSALCRKPTSARFRAGLRFRR